MILHFCIFFNSVKIGVLNVQRCNPPNFPGNGGNTLKTITGYKYSLTTKNGTYSSTVNNTNSPLIIYDASLNPYFAKQSTYTVAFVTVNSSNNTSIPSNEINITVVPIPCFKSGSKILTNRGYKRIETLRAGDKVKTVLNGFQPIWKLGKKRIHHPAIETRIKEQLYVCSAEVYSEVFEDLVITGCHSILVDEWSSEEEKELAIKANGGNVYITDDFYRLPACADIRTRVYEQEGYYTIYHLALENNDYYANYGIYANGLLVESCSKRYLAELSGMEIV